MPASKIKMRNKELGIRNQEWVRELGGGAKNTTNNRMELTAVIKSLEFVSKLEAKSLKPIAIHTDSSYVLKGATEWIENWQENKWKTKSRQNVENQNLWKNFLRINKKIKIKWHLIPGHSGISANERCDEIATAFADGKRPKLYSGFLKNYGIDVSLAVTNLEAKNNKSKARKGKAYSYVSMVDGVIKTHDSWTLCEKRVKKVSGAKFKKALSPEDERNIINLWSQNRLF